MSRILVVEDDPSILRGLVDMLRLESHDVLPATDGKAALELFRKEAPELIILDLMLPKMSGLEVCRLVRAEGDTVPILMLTARGEEMDRVLGLDLGADDYVTKPFSVPELLARIRALLRRTTMASQNPQMLRFGEVEIDFQKYEAKRAGRMIRMSRKEYGILRHLASKAGNVVSREELLNEVWGYDTYPSTRTVDNHIAALRAKLEVDPAEPQHLLTIHGVGYRLVGDA